MDTLLLTYWLGWQNNYFHLPKTEIALNEVKEMSGQFYHPVICWDEESWTSGLRTAAATSLVNMRIHRIALETLLYIQVSYIFMTYVLLI